MVKYTQCAYLGPRPVVREIKLEPSLRAPSAARRFVADVLTELGHVTYVDNAELIASELVTNSVVNTDAPVWLAIWRTGPFLLLEVWDCSPEPPKPAFPELFEEHGRGLQIVDQVSILMGYETFCFGKVVWVLLGVTCGEVWERARRRKSLLCSRDVRNEIRFPGMYVVE
jgi:hypothetical protein